MTSTQSTLADDRDAETRDAAQDLPRGTEPTGEQEGPSEESLIEEVSIDGMCGVY